MTKQRFYPYPVCDGLELTVTSLEPEQSMDPNTRYLRLWEAPADLWKLQLEIHVPEDAAEQVLPESERSDPPLEIAVTLRSASSRIREAMPFELAPGTTKHEFVLDYTRWSGLIEVDASLVRTRDATTAGGPWATRGHTVVGRAEQVRIDVDEPARPPGDSLEIRWENFAESSIVSLNQHPDHLFALRESGIGEAPILYLNQGVEGAVATLTSTATTGAKARARDAAFQTIAHQVWSSVLASCLSELKDNTLTDQEVSMEDALDALEPWMRAVIEQWAPWLCPDAGESEALQNVWELVDGGKWENLLTDRMPTAISARFDTTRGFRGLVKEFDL